MNTYSWAKRIEGIRLHDLIIGAVALLIAFVQVSDSQSWPDFLPLNGTLTVALFFLAAQRIHIVAHLERSMAPAWDRYIVGSPRYRAHWDLPLEPFWFASLLLLPVAAISLPLFASLYLVSSLVESAYGALALRTIGSAQSDHASRRSSLFSLLLLLRLKWEATAAMLAAVAAVLAVLSVDSRATFATVGWVYLVVMVILNAFMHVSCVRLSQEVDDLSRKLRLNQNPELDTAQWTTIERLHEEAFSPEERMGELREFVVSNDSQVRRLWTVSVDEAIIGYLVIEFATSRKYAILWYLALDSRWRGYGVGGALWRSIDAAVIAEFPTARAMVFECRRPQSGTSDESRRVRFFRNQGSYWIRGTSYSATSDSGWAIEYDPMVYPLADLTEFEIRVMIVEMASIANGRAVDEAMIDLDSAVFTPPLCENGHGILRRVDSSGLGTEPGNE